MGDGGVEAPNTILRGFLVEVSSVQNYGAEDS